MAALEDGEMEIPSGLYLRTENVPHVSRTFTKAADHPTAGMVCLGCGEPFAAGDRTVLVLLGPGGDPEARQKAVDGRFYNAVCAELHAACATGDPDR